LAQKPWPFRAKRFLGQQADASTVSAEAMRKSLYTPMLSKGDRE